MSVSVVGPFHYYQSDYMGSNLANEYLEQGTYVGSVMIYYVSVADWNTLIAHCSTLEQGPASQSPLAAWVSTITMTWTCCATALSNETLFDSRNTYSTITLFL